MSLVAIVICHSCSNNDESSADDLNPIIPLLTEEIEVYEPALIHNNLTLIVKNLSKEAYLVDKSGERLFTWNFESSLGNDFELLPNGQGLGMFKVENPSITLGGYGGLIKIINPDGSIAWQYEYSGPNTIAHHDVELLPNGNVLFMVWENIDVESARQIGLETPFPVVAEKLVELDPVTNTIVWEWKSWDHIIQDTNMTLPNFGAVSNQPNRIDFGYNLDEGHGDIMHANGIDYDENNDLIYLSVNFYNEVWVIDHSTSTTEAASSSDGNYNKGGDLVYRFGNPLAYKNTVGNVLFDRNHFPNLLEDGVPGEGNLLIYVNGKSVGQSTVYELAMPDVFDLAPNINNEPSIVWSYTNEDLFFLRISGAVRLTNGNTLICEGDYGLWEVTPSGEIAWKFKSLEGNVWRAYDYNIDDTALPHLGIDF